MSNQTVTPPKRSRFNRAQTPVASAPLSAQGAVMSKIQLSVKIVNFSISNKTPDLRLYPKWEAKVNASPDKVITIQPMIMITNAPEGLRTFLTGNIILLLSPFRYVKVTFISISQEAIRIILKRTSSSHQLAWR